MNNAVSGWADSFFYDIDLALSIIKAPEGGQKGLIAYCPEVSGANGQGRTKEEARESLAAAISLILEDRREDALRGAPPEAERETVIVE